MSKSSRTALNIMVLLGLCIGFGVLSADWTVALVPTSIVALFFVNADSILEALTSAWLGRDDALK